MNIGLDDVLPLKQFFQNFHIIDDFFFMWKYPFTRRLMQCFSLCEKVRIKVLLFGAHGCEDDARFYGDYRKALLEGLTSRSGGKMILS